MSEIDDNQKASDSGEEKQMVRDAGMLSVLTMVSRILGLVREMTKAVFLGTGVLSDAFSVSFMIPNFMRRLFAENSISVAFIPTFKGYLHDKDEKATKQFLSSSLTVLLILVGSVVALGIAATPWIVKAFGSDPAETIVLTRIMFPFLALVSIAALFQGILNSFGVFAPSGFAPILFNVCFIVVPWAISRWMPNPARAMAIGVVTGGMAQALWQLPAVLKTGIRFGFISPRAAFSRNSCNIALIRRAHPKLLSDRDRSIFVSAHLPAPRESRADRDQMDSLPAGNRISPCTWG